MQQGQCSINGAQCEHKSHAQGGREGAKRTARGELVLIRGLPGSGKSTMALVLAQVGYVHYEADMYFMQDGQYQYDSRQVRQAHQWCREQTLRALQAGKRVVVSNTFTRLQEMEPYFPWPLTFAWWRRPANGKTYMVCRQKHCRPWQTAGKHCRTEQSDLQVRAQGVPHIEKGAYQFGTRLSGREIVVRRVSLWSCVRTMSLSCVQSA